MPRRISLFVVLFVLLIIVLGTSARCEERVYLDPTTTQVIACRKWTNFEVAGTQMQGCKAADVSEIFSAPRCHFFRVPAAGVHAEMIFGAGGGVNVSTTRWIGMYRWADGFVVVPVCFWGPVQAQSLMVVRKFADGREETILPPTRVAALPTWPRTP